MISIASRRAAVASQGRVEPRSRLVAPLACSAEHIALARRLASSSAVLLLNKPTSNRNSLLPLRAGDVVALVGSACDAAHEIDVEKDDWMKADYYVMGGSGRVVSDRAGEEDHAGSAHLSPIRTRVRPPPLSHLISPSPHEYIIPFFRTSSPNPLLAPSAHFLARSNSLMPCQPKHIPAYLSRMLTTALQPRHHLSHQHIFQTARHNCSAAHSPQIDQPPPPPPPPPPLPPPPPTAVATTAAAAATTTTTNTAAVSA